MALKRFNADMRSARRRLEYTDIPGIITLERGKLDGEAIVTFVHEKLPVPILIRLVCAEPASYPDGNNFLLSTDSQDITPTVASALEDLQNFTFGLTVSESLRDVSSGLIRALSQSSVDADGYTNMKVVVDDDPGSDHVNDDNDESFQEQDPEEEGYEENEDLIFSLGSRIGQKSKPSRLGTKMNTGVLNKIRRDLRKAREAGAKVGILSGVRDDARTHTVSLSIRARKLGISDEALEAWDVDPSDYIVLLCRVDEPYPSVEKLSVSSSSSFHAEFRFGKCSRSKPSSDSARRAFVTQSPKPRANLDATVQATDTSTDSHPFSRLFISHSIELFMNEHFLALTKFRLTGCQSWDEANSQIQDLFVRYQTPKDTAGVAELYDCNGKGKAKEQRNQGESADAQSSYANAHKHQTLPTILTWDSFVESTKEISMPLVAMQFALHYFVRCTEYCL